MKEGLVEREEHRRSSRVGLGEEGLVERDS